MTMMTKNYKTNDHDHCDKNYENGIPLAIIDDVDENNGFLFRKFMSNIQRCFTGEGARGLDFISPR